MAEEVQITHSRTNKLELVWEEQDPFVRSNISTSLTSVLLVIATHLAVWFGVRMLSQDQVLRLGEGIRFLQMILFFLAMVMTYNALRTIYQYVRGQGVISVLGILLAWGSILVLIVAVLNIPSVLKASIAHSSGRTFGSTYDIFSGYCDDWLENYDLVADVDLKGVEFSGASEVYGVMNTIIVNFSDDPLDYGLACVLDHDTPAENGRAVRYQYTSLDAAKYGFIEKASQ